MANFILPVSSEWTNVTYPSKASTAYAEGEFIYNDGTNDIPATTSTQLIRGINLTVKSASDTSTADHVMRVPRNLDSSFKAVATGTLTAAMVGRSFDLASSTSVAQATSTYKPVTLVKFIDANTGIFRLNMSEGVNAS